VVAEAVHLVEKFCLYESDFSARRTFRIEAIVITSSVLRCVLQDAFGANFRYQSLFVDQAYAV
jgi:hypothetical protein